MNALSRLSLRQNSSDTIFSAVTTTFKDGDAAHLVARHLRPGSPGNCAWQRELPALIHSVLAIYLGCAIVVLENSLAAHSSMVSTSSHFQRFSPCAFRAVNSDAEQKREKTQSAQSVTFLSPTAGVTCS